MAGLQGGKSTPVCVECRRGFTVAEAKVAVRIKAGYCHKKCFDRKGDS